MSEEDYAAWAFPNRAEVCAVYSARTHQSFKKLVTIYRRLSGRGPEECALGATIALDLDRASAATKRLDEPILRMSQSL